MRAQRRPSVLVLTHFFPPEPCAAASRAASLVAALVRADFAVHVVTGVANFPSGTIAPGESVRFPRTATRADAVRITRVPTFASPVASGRNRIANWLSVAFGMAIYAVAMRRRHDVVFATMPPITLALPALLAKARHRARLVVDVRDVFPDVAVRMGFWAPRSPMARAVGAVAKAMYRAADVVQCVTTSAIAEIRDGGCPPERIVLATNGFDPPTAGEMPPFERRADEFVVAFAGNMGLATGLDTVLDAARSLREAGRVRFVLAGDGADRARLAARVRDEELDNVTFTGVVSRAQANALLASADVAVVPLHPGLTDSLPTKLFDAMALGCPVVCAANGEARAFVERSGGGVVVAPGDGVALAAALRSLRDDETRRRSLIDAGRSYVLEHYDRAHVMDAVARNLRTLLAAPSGTATRSEPSRARKAI